MVSERYKLPVVNKSSGYIIQIRNKVNNIAVTLNGNR